jgi:hypothetical protein
MSATTIPFPDQYIEVQQRYQAGKVTWAGPLTMLVIRPVLFVFWQAVIAGLLAVRGVDNPWGASAAWWPWTAILTSLACLVMLSVLLRREGGQLRDLYRLDRRYIGRDILLVVGLSVLGLPVSYLPSLALGAWLFGSMQVVYRMFFQPLPMWAAVSAVILFPIMISLSELPTYFGYVMPRLEALSGRRWLAVLLPSFFLAIQHGALPLIFDARFIAWRVIMYVAFAALVGLLLRWRPRLMPYLIVGHYLMDLMTIVTILMPPA